MIQQSAFDITHSAGRFIGIVAFNPDVMSGDTAAQRAWGTDSERKELAWQELAALTREGMVVYTCSIQK